MLQTTAINKLHNLKVSLVTHSRTTGLSQILRDWLVNKVKMLIYIDHPLYPTKNINSFMTFYKNGKVWQKKQSSWEISGIFNYFKDTFLTFYYIIKTNELIDLAIGVDNLNTIILIFCKKIGRIKKVIYHTVDYTPKRFANRILNNIYHKIDTICCYNADIIWNSSGRMNDGRVKNGAQKNKIAYTIITPDGSNFDHKKRLPLSKINRKRIVFLGHLRERLGLEMILLSFAKVIKKVPNAQLTIIGDGPLMTELKNIVKNNNLSKNVVFTGFVEKHEEVDDILREGAIGLAIFEPIKESIEYYSDAGKPKVYLAAGLPVIITEVPEIATEIGTKKAGILVKYDKEDIAKAIVKLLTEDLLYREYRKNAIELSKEYIWDNIFMDAFSKTFKYFNKS